MQQSFRTWKNRSVTDKLTIHLEFCDCAVRKGSIESSYEQSLKTGPNQEHTSMHSRNPIRAKLNKTDPNFSCITKTPEIMQTKGRHFSTYDSGLKYLYLN